jgi:hypothetical protein
MSIGAMDASWQWTKVFDAEMTPPELWTLVGSGKISYRSLLVQKLLKFKTQKKKLLEKNTCQNSWL